MAVMCGVYLIRNIVNWKVYVGSSVNIRQRWWGHRSNLRRRKSASLRLQHAWNKYGESSFEWSVLEECDSCNLVECEQKFIDAFSSTDVAHGYNLKDVAANRLTYSHTEETKRKLSESRKGKKLTEEAKLRLRGRKTPQDVIEKIRKSMTGKKFGPCPIERREAISRSKKGKSTITPEGLESRRQRMTGNKNHQYGKTGSMSPCFGRTHSSDTRLKMSSAAKGVPKSDAHKLAMSKANATFTDRDIDKIRTYRACGITLRVIAIVMGCSRPHISSILRGKYIAYKTGAV